MTEPARELTLRMKLNFTKQSGRRGFSLIEVILAIGVFAFTIVAVLAMLGSTSQATSEVLNTATASKIADAIRAELETLDFDADLAPAAGGTEIILYGTKDGRYVVLGDPGGGPGGPVDNDPDPKVSDTPGIAARDRFFKITLEELGGKVDELAYDADKSAQIAFSVKLEWPHNIPLGPPSANPMTDDVKTTEVHQRSVSIFNLSIPRTF